MVLPIVKGDFNTSCTLHYFPGRFHAIEMEPFWRIQFLFYTNFLCRGKRPATAANGSSNVASKKGRGAGGLQNQLVNRALEGLSHGGRGGTRGRGRGWGGRGRGRGFR